MIRFLNLSLKCLTLNVWASIKPCSWKRLQVGWRRCASSCSGGWNPHPVPWDAVEPALPPWEGWADSDTLMEMSRVNELSWVSAQRCLRPPGQGTWGLLGRVSTVSLLLSKGTYGPWSPLNWKNIRSRYHVVCHAPFIALGFKQGARLPPGNTCQCLEIFTLSGLWGDDADI